MWLMVAPAPPIVDLQLHVISPPLTAPPPATKICYQGIEYHQDITWECISNYDKLIQIFNLLQKTALLSLS